MTEPNINIIGKETIHIEIPQEDEIQIVTRTVPVRRETIPTSDNSFPIYVASFLSLLFPIIGILYLTMTMCCFRNEPRTIGENRAIRLLFLFTFFGIFVYINMIS